jgi:nucleoside-diphosphate-sugar epimerase
MKILVTGATGFLGRRLSYELAKNGADVIALCRNMRHPFLMAHENIRAVQGDILDRKSLVRAMKGCDQVYHTAALAKMWCRNLDDFYHVNVTGTRFVLETAAECRIQKLVYTSTCAVWGPTIKHPMSEEDPRTDGYAINYERTKYLAELETRKFADKELQVITVNPSRIFGEGPMSDSNTVGKMVSSYLKGRWRMIPGSGEQVANYAYLSDVVQGHINAMKMGVSGDRYILGGEDISYNQFFQTLRTICGKNYTMLKVPQKLIEAYSYAQLFKTTLTGLAPSFLPEFAERLKKDQKYSSQKAIDNLNYRITPFAVALEKTIQHLQQWNRVSLQ